MLSISSNRASDLNIINKTLKGVVFNKDGKLRSNLQGIIPTKYKLQVSNVQIEMATNP